MSICYERYQTEKEMDDAKGAIRCFTTYNIFLNDKAIGGSLQAALDENSIADRNHVGEEERAAIRKKLESAFLASHPGYEEPTHVKENN